MKGYILALILILIVIPIFSGLRIIEPMLVYDVEIDRKTVNVNSTGYNLSRKALAILEKTPFVSVNKARTPSYFITDSYNIPQDSKFICAVNDEKAFLIVKKTNAYRNEHLSTFVKRDVTIGYPDDMHLRVFKGICKCLEIDTNTLKLVKADNVDAVDALLFFESLDNQKITWPSIDFIDYTCDLKNIFPYGKLYTGSLDVYFPGYMQKFVGRTYVKFDMVLVGPSTDFPPVSFGRDAETNFLRRYYNA